MSLVGATWPDIPDINTWQHDTQHKGLNNSRRPTSLQQSNREETVKRQTLVEAVAPKRRSVQAPAHIELGLEFDSSAIAASRARQNNIKQLKKQRDGTVIGQSCPSFKGVQASRRLKSFYYSLRRCFSSRLKFEVVVGRPPLVDEFCGDDVPGEHALQDGFEVWAVLPAVPVLASSGSWAAVVAVVLARLADEAGTDEVGVDEGPDGADGDNVAT